MCKCIGCENDDADDDDEINLMSDEEDSDNDDDYDILCIFIVICHYGTYNDLFYLHITKSQGLLTYKVFRLQLIELILKSYFL